MSEDFANWSAGGRAAGQSEAELRETLESAGHRSPEAALGLVEVATSGLEAETVMALETAIHAADDPETRQFAVEALGAAGEDTVGIETALEDDCEWVRAEAVVACSRVYGAPTSLLRDVLETDDSGWVRRNALVALGKRGEATPSTCIDRLKHDPHPAVREFAAQYLRTGEDVEGAVRILAAVLAREPNAFVRVKAAESLGHLGTDRAEAALETQGLGDRSDDVRRTAKRALARARGVDPDALDVEETALPGGGRGSHGARTDPPAGGGPGGGGPGGGGARGGGPGSAPGPGRPGDAGPPGRPTSPRREGRPGHAKKPKAAGPSGRSWPPGPQPGDERRQEDGESDG